MMHPHRCRPQKEERRARRAGCGNRFSGISLAALEGILHLLFDVPLDKGRSYGLLASGERDHQLGGQDAAEAGVVERRQNAALREKDK